MQGTYYYLVHDLIIRRSYLTRFAFLYVNLLILTTYNNAGPILNYFNRKLTTLKQSVHDGVKIVIPFYKYFLSIRYIPRDSHTHSQIGILTLLL
jgi:hypothetical protein